MNKRVCRAGLALVCLVLVLSVPAQAKEEWINDILIAPARYWNMQVTLIGEVQNVNANPAGTTRGTYTLLDDSCPNVIVIRTKDLPPLGRAFRVTGIVMQDPANAAVPVIKELERTAAGGLSGQTRTLLIVLGALMALLVIVFLILLLKPKKAANAPPAAQAVITPPARRESPKGPAPTIVVPRGAPQGGETQMLQNPVAELMVEQGSDRGKAFTVTAGSCTIGRSGTRLNDVQLSDPTVSKEQASLYYDAGSGKLSIVNESAKNPTRVNGVVVAGTLALKGNDLIEMGKTALRIKFL
ncbi:MAG: FHA domain-containing protein [Acidobacteria bacterium]|nr:FHA domain-containing protein [Acidobacteriota bacterium]